MVINKQNILHLLKSNRQILKKYGIQKIGLFGSYLQSQQSTESDIDLLVEFRPHHKNFKNFMAAADYTEQLLGKRVDFVTTESLSPYLAPKITSTVEYVQIT